MNYIVPNPNASCPACGNRMGLVVLLCSDCWLVLPNKLKAELRYMVFNKQDYKSKMAKCVRVVREKRGLPETHVFVTQYQQEPIPPAPTERVTVLGEIKPL